jgi:hypothetical protein
MKKIIWMVLSILVFSGCSKTETKKAEINPPIYVSFDKEGKMLFGPISQNISLSNGEGVLGTDHTISVFCEKLTHSEALLVFQEYTPKGSLVREAKRAVPLGVGFTFQIFETLDVTIRNKI